MCGDLHKFTSQESALHVVYTSLRELPTNVFPSVLLPYLCLPFSLDSIQDHIMRILMSDRIIMQFDFGMVFNSV